MSLDYHIIGSGSSGNSVRIQNILIDCGLPFSKIKEDLYKVDTLLITHSHSDHIKPATYKRIRKEFPRIKVYGNYDVAYRYDIDIVVGTAAIILPTGTIIQPFEAVHDVPTTGYVLQLGDQTVLYMTDSSKVTAPDIKYDWFFLESNYDERKLRELGKQYKSGRYDPTQSSLRHLSTQKCKEYYFVHRKSKESQLVELHKSSRFY